MGNSTRVYPVVDRAVRRLRSVNRVVLRIFVAALVSVCATPVLADGVPFHAGDVVVTGTSGYGYYWDSQIRHYSSTGVLLDTFDLGVGNTWPASVAFDSIGNMYVPITGSSYNPSQLLNTVLKINGDGSRAGGFGGTYGGASVGINQIVFSSSGNAYIGADGLPNKPAPIFKVDGRGNVLATYAAQWDPTSGFGVDYAYLAADQCTIRYTSMGESVKQFNVCTGTQMPNLVDSFPDPAAQPPYELLYSIRGIDNGNMLVGTWEDFVYGLNKDGHVIQQYVANDSPYPSLSYVAVDPKQKTFIALDMWSGRVYQFDVQSGALLSKFTLFNDNFSPTSIAIVPAAQSLYDPGKNLGKPCNCAGDPINLATGNEFRDDGDLSLGALSFHRYYNSDSTVASTHVGANWRSSFDRSIEYAGGKATAATIFRADGRQLKFTLAAGQWTPDPDVSDRLMELMDASGAVTGWDYFDAATRYHEGYDRDGKLLSMTDTNGQVTTLAYSAADTPAGVAPAPGLLLAVTGPHGRTLGFSYDSNAQLTALREPDGGVIAYGHDTKGNLTSVTYPDKTSHRYVYNESSLTGGANLSSALTGSIDEAGNRYTSIGYNAQGQAVLSMLASGVEETRVAYNAGGTTTVSYPTGAQTTLNFVAPYGSMHTSTVSSPCGPECGQPNRSATFDANGRVASATDFNGSTTKTAFGANGLLAQQVDASGTPVQRTTSLRWNTSLRVPLTRIVADASGAVVSSTQWVYNTRGQPLARCEIDPGNRAASGYACSVSGTVPAGVRRWTYTYCDAVDDARCPLIGLLLSSTGPRTDVAQVTRYSYYLANSAVDCGTPGAACHQAGDLHTITDALGHVTTIASYDADGRVTRQTDPNGVHTDLAYTPRGWLASRRVGGATTRFTYTPYGAVASMIDPDNVTTRYAYDAAHRLTGITDSLGNRVQYTLDAAGNKTAEQVLDSNHAVRRRLGRTFNMRGELTKVVDGLNRTVFSASASDGYDANGNLVHSADSLGVQQRRSYDALDRLVSTIENYNGTDAATKNTLSLYAYDALDRLNGVSDPDDLVTSYDYDGLGDAVALHSPDTGTTMRRFDAAGDLLSSTDARGVTSTYTYDALGRRTGAGYPDNTQNVAYRYDEANGVTGCARSAPVGRLTRIVEAATTTVYCYDPQGRVIRKRQIVSSGSDTVDYAYTAAGRLRALGYPDGSRANYTRDADGRIRAIEVVPVRGGAVTAVNDVTYLPFGPVSGYKLGNGQTVTRTYDANYRLTDLASPAFSLHAARDAMGNITAIGNAPGANPATETYSYDPLYRLTAITQANGSALENVTYNQTGDRLSKRGSGLATGAYRYKPGTHQLVSTGNATRAADANGNTTAVREAGVAYGLGYDNRNRLSVAQLNGNTVAAYAYNALGERIVKDLSGRNPHGGQGGHGNMHGPRGQGGGRGIERFAYDEGSRLLAEHGKADRDYVWLDDIPVANVDTRGFSTVTYVVADQLGTPRAISNGTGAVIWRWAYQGNAWGEQMPTSNGYTYNPRFPGQYFDAETGLSYSVNRDYDPATARYIQSDPIGLTGGWSTYAYVNGNPLSRVDSLGLMCNQQGCWNTKTEMAYAQAGNYAMYYQTACAGNDSYACAAGVVATGVGDSVSSSIGAKFTNANLHYALRIGGSKCPEKDMESIRNDLMRARVKQLSKATPSNPFRATAKDISDFHNAIFKRYGATKGWGPFPVFGGDIPIFGNTGGWRWCSGAACQP